MINLSTNLSALNIQRSLLNSTKLLNKAIERLTTGFKVNKAADNAANFNIIQQMNTQISALDIAEDNVAMGIDMVSTANDIAEMINDKLTRLRNLATQAQNETYGKDSLDAINTECNALVDEIERLYEEAEYNGIKLYGFEVEEEPVQAVMTYSARMLTAATVEATADTNTSLKELGIEESSFSVLNKDGTEIIAYDTESTDTLGDIFNVLSGYGITSSITDGVITMTSDNGNHVCGDLIEKLGISIDSYIAIDSSAQSSMQSVSYTLTLTATESTTLAELGALSSGKVSMTVNDKYGDKEGNITVYSTTTLGEMFNELSRFDIQGSITDGCITLESSSGNYVVDNSVMSALGITNEIGTSYVTSGVTNTSTTPVTYTETTTEGGYTYTTTIEQTNTIWTTTTTSTTETNTVWITTTTETTQTSTIEETTTIPVVTTVTVYTTTTTPQTVTETIFVTNTVSTTVGNTISSTVPVTYETVTTGTTVTETSTSVGKVVMSSAPITYTSTVIEKVTTSTVTNGVAMTSSAAITYTSVGAVNENTKLSDFLDLSDTYFEGAPVLEGGEDYAYGYFGYDLQYIVDEGLADSVENITLGDLFEYISNDGFVGSVSADGVITITSNDPMYYLTGSIFEQMGITTNIIPAATHLTQETIESSESAYIQVPRGTSGATAIAATADSRLYELYGESGDTQSYKADDYINIAIYANSRYYTIYQGTMSDFIYSAEINFLDDYSEVTLGLYAAALQYHINENTTYINIEGYSIGSDGIINLNVTNNTSSYAQFYVCMGENWDDGYTFCAEMDARSEETVSSAYTFMQAVDYCDAYTYITALTDCSVDYWYTDASGNKYSEIYLSYYDRDLDSTESVTITYSTTATIGTLKNLFAEYDLELSIGSNGKIYLEQKGEYVYDGYGGADIDYGFKWYSYSWDYAETDAYATMSSSDKLVASSLHILDYGYSMSDMGFIPATYIDEETGKYYDEIIINDITNSTLGFAIRYYSDTTFTELKNELANYGIDLTINNGVVNINSTGNYYIQDLGSLAEEINMDGQVGYYVTAKFTNTTNVVTKTMSNDTTLEELGLDKNKTYVVEYDLITISIEGTKTVGEMCSALSVATPAGIDGRYGTFHFYSSRNNGEPTLKSIDPELAQALNLSTDIRDYFDITTTYSTTTVTTTSTLTMTEDTTFAELGLDEATTYSFGLRKYGQNTGVSMFSADTIKDLISRLAVYSITASVTDGVFTINDYNDLYIWQVNGDLANALGISSNASDYYTTSVSSTTTSSTSTSTIYTTETVASTETNTVFETVTGGEVVVTTIQETQTTSEETTTTVWTTTTTSTTETETITTEHTVPETSTTVLKTMTVGTTMQNLGVNNETYITVQKGATQTIITVASSDTINQLKSKLASVGINSSVSQGKLTLSPISESNYIIGASDELEVALGLNENYYTVESGLEMTDSSLLQYQRVYVMNEASQLSEYGVTDGNIYVIKDGEAYGTIYVSSSESVQSILSDISAYGFTTSIKNGNVSIKSNGNIFLSETDSMIAMMALGDDSSNLLSVFNIGNVVQTESVVYSNTPSNTLLPQTVSPDPYYQAVDSVNIQAGIGSDSSNQIKVSTGFVLDELDTLRNIGKNTVTKHDYLRLLDDMIATVSAKQVEYGAAINRLESAFEEISIRYDNLVSSRSTLRDADVAEESANLIKYQILQQAGATLLATANQTPSIALRLL